MEWLDRQESATVMTGVMVNALRLTAVTITLIGVSTQALATHKVYSPHVEKGEIEIEARGHVDFDDDNDKDKARKDIFEIGYGLTDWWRTSLFVEYEEEPQGDYEHAATAWENIFQVTESGKYWMDVGLYLEYEVPEGSDPDSLEIKGLFEKEVKRFVNTANLIFERQVGGNASKDIELGYAWRTKYRLRTDFEPGLELYGDLGELDDWDINDDQNHQAGPVATGKFHLGEESAIVYELGYLFGLTSESPDGSVKWMLEFEHEF